jgi:hypothetical protein
MSTAVTVAPLETLVPLPLGAKLLVLVVGVLVFLGLFAVYYLADSRRD